MPSSKHATLALVQDLGVAHEHSSSMPSALTPRTIRKKPISPQYSPQELRTIQYLTPSFTSPVAGSTSPSVSPHPTMDTMWLISYDGVSVMIPPV